MTSPESWERLLDRARDEPPPGVDVRAAVAVRLAEQPAPTRSSLGAWLLARGLDPALTAAASVSLGLALIVGLASLPVADELLDPLRVLLQGTEVVQR